MGIISREGLVNYIRDNWYRIQNVTNEALQLESTVVMENGNTKKSWRFVGNGCGVVYLNYTSKTPNTVFNKLVNEVHNTYGLQKFMNMFGDEQTADLEKSGIPLAALWEQDYMIQKTFFNICSEYANANGINCTVYARLD